VALRRPQVDQAEQLVRIADVLAEVAGANPSRGFDEEAERLAGVMSPRVPVTRDWSNRPCLSWTDGERMLLRMRRDLAEDERERTERLAAAELAATQMVPAGTISVTAPGRPDWWAPGHEPPPYTGPKVTQVPG
jgi:hypothetical protein